MNTRWRIALAGSAASAVVVLNGAGWAQETPGGGAATAGAPPTELQEIVVTANKRSENVQLVPISVVSVSSEALESRGINNIMDLGRSVPGLQLGTSEGVVLPFLRGVGTTASIAGNEASVATYVDGVYFSRLSSGFFDLSNIDRVEVLQGPQGTLFGRNSTGGVINVITRDPSFTPAIKGSVGYGNEDAFRGNVYASTGVTDQIAVDLGVSGLTSDGYGKNLTTGNPYGYNNYWLVRSKVLYEPLDGTKIVLSGYITENDQSIQRTPFPGTTAAINNPPFTVVSSQDIGFYNSKENTDAHAAYQLWGVSGRIEQDLSFAQLVSISAYSHVQEDGHPSTLYSVQTNETAANIEGPNRQFTQEFQLLNKPGAPLDWLVGYYYYNNYTAYNGVPTLLGPGLGPGINAPAHQQVSSNAVFGQATVTVLPKLKLTGGLRYTADETSAYGTEELNTSPPIPLENIPPGSKGTYKLTYRLALDYQFTDDIAGYISYNRSFKSGNFNLLTYTSDQPTNPEKIDAYEIGLKTELFDHRLRLNGAFFDYEIKDPQVQLERSTTVFFSNAGGSTDRGGEIDLLARVAPGLNGRFQLTALDSFYTNYLDAPASTPNLAQGGAIVLPPINAAGHRTPLAPRVTFDIGGDYSFGSPIGNITLTADLYYNSGYYFEPDNLLHQGKYYLLNAQIRDDLTDNISVRLWANNINNAKYITDGSTISGFLGYQFQSGPPVTYGAALDFEF